MPLHNSPRLIRLLAVIAVMLVSLGRLASAAEFGCHPTPDPSYYSQRASGGKCVMKFRTGAAPGITDSIYGYFHHNHNGSDTIDFVIYADSSGSPSALVDTGTTCRVVNTTQAWYGAALTGQSLSANTDYWLGFLVRAGGTSVRIYDDGTSSDSLKTRFDTPPPDNPFGTGGIATVLEGKLAIYVKYTTTSAPFTSRRRLQD